MYLITAYPVLYICRLDHGATVLNPYTPVFFERF